MKGIKTLLVTSCFVLLASCGGGGGGEGTANTSKVSFSVSDAPVDSALAVYVGFEQIEFRREDGSSEIFSVTPTNPGEDYVRVNLLDYQGTNSALIVSEAVIPQGSYQSLILHVTDEPNVNIVVDGSGSQPLKQPSNKLKLGSITISEDASQAFTIEFDLRMALVMRGNPGNNNGYILKPHGVSVVNSESTSSIAGTVDASLFNPVNSTCSADSGSNFVYLYSGDQLANAANLIDLVDETDDTFNTGPLPNDAVQPVASTQVADDGSYIFGFLSPGEYTAVFSCNAANDDSVQFDNIDIPNPDTDTTQLVTTSAGEAKQDIDFPPAP